MSQTDVERDRARAGCSTRAAARCRSRSCTARRWSPRATWALSEAGVLPVDARTTIDGLADAGPAARAPRRALPDDAARTSSPTCVRRAVDEDVVVAGVRPVTDTVKTLDGEHARRDRRPRGAGAGRLAASWCPPPGGRARPDLLADPAVDLAALVEALRAGGPVVLVEAPPEAMRVAGARRRARARGAHPARRDQPLGELEVLRGR